MLALSLLGKSQISHWLYMVSKYNIQVEDNSHPNS